jgi:general secretion pathway protein H
MTLVEVLVVLSIIGIATGATVLSLNGANRASRSEAEARRLAQNLNLAMDEALADGAPLALVWDARGYKFLRWSPDASGWVPSKTPLLARHDLSAVLSLDQPGTEGTPPVMLSPASGATPTDFAFEGTTPVWHVRFDGFTASPNVEGPR